MKRRPFIKTLAAGSAGLSAAAVTGVSCNADNRGKEKYSETFATIPEFSREMLINKENDFISLKYYNDASAEIYDKINGQAWQMIPVALQENGGIDIGDVWLRTERSFCEQYPGRFYGQMAGDSIRFSLYGYLWEYTGSFNCEISLDGPWLRFRITDIDSSIPSLVFPTPILSESLVFPSGIGRWIRKPLEARHFWTFFSHLNMRWFGGLSGNNGWLGLFSDGFCDGGVMTDQLLAAPGWIKSLDTWNNPRTISYCFTSEGYVGLAKKYREWAVQNNIHRPLTDKYIQHPLLKNLLGGRSLSFWMSSPPRDENYYYDRWRKVPENIDEYRNQVEARILYKDADAMIRQAMQEGMKNGIAVVRGWIKNGYDGSHPDIWPPNTALGSMEELKNIMSQPGEIISALHDNYADIYPMVPSFPKGVIRRKDGSMMRGGYWGGGQCYIIHGKYGLDYARRNWELIKTLDPGAMFIDTTTAVQMYQTFEQDDPLTRTQDLEYKKELLKFYADQGKVIGSEEGADFGVPYAGWFENRHSRIQGETIPLWPLVFHDAVFSTRYTGNHLNPVGNGSDVPQYLADMLWGYHLNYNFRNAEGMEYYSDDFKSTQIVDEWHRKVGDAEMTDHRFLTDDMMVEQTIFSSGQSIIVNFDSRDRTVENRIIKAGSYLIMD